MTARRIVIVVGTDHHPFQRLVDWADQRQRGGDQVLIQYGQSAAPAAADGVDFLAPALLRAELGAADVVITHGGPGTISDARRSGHRPIVVPRDPTLGEHVDDHQQRFAQWCAERGVIDLARTVADLDQRLDSGADTRTPATTAAQTERAVAAFAELAARPRVSRRSSAAAAPRILWCPAGTASVAAAADGGDVVVLGRLDPTTLPGADPREIDQLARVARRRFPGRADRGRLLAAAAPYRTRLEAASADARGAWLAVEGSWDLLAVLSHDRRLELTVAAPVDGLGPRLLVARRRLRVAPASGLLRPPPA